MFVGLDFLKFGPVSTHNAIICALRQLKGSPWWTMCLTCSSKNEPGKRLVVVLLELGGVVVWKSSQDFPENQLTVMKIGSVYHLADVDTIMRDLNAIEAVLTRSEG